MKTPALTLIFLLVLFVARGAAAADQPGLFPFGSDEVAAQFLKQVKATVAGNDKARVADNVRFPVAVRLRGKSVKVSRPAFVARYDEIFTPAVKTVLANARFESTKKYSGVWWNAQGMMLGNGELWFAETGAGAVKIITINN